MKTIILASNNSHKIKEFRELLLGYDIKTMNDIGFVDDIEENGKTFLENAVIKAKAITKYINEKNIDAVVLADDSGLSVDALNGEPGVYSARYSGDHDMEANRQKLLKKLAHKNNRNAKFTCCIVKMQKDYSFQFVEEYTFGYITKEYHGKTDFGYDCLFYSTDLNKTFGEATDQEKNSVSHRGRAIQKLKELF